MPYNQHSDGDNIRRTFIQSCDDTELVWHRDREDRNVTVVCGKGWYIQLDNQLPEEMIQGETYSIPRETYHRITKGSTNLELSIAFIY